MFHIKAGAIYKYVIPAEVLSDLVSRGRGEREENVETGPVVGEVSQPLVLTVLVGTHVSQVNLCGCACVCVCVCVR